MRITMVKKRLSDGLPCKKCIQAEEMLARRGLLERINEFAWVDEGEATSPGAVLAREFHVDVAPFFVIHRDGEGPLVHTNVTLFVKWLTGLQPRQERIDEKLDHIDPMSLAELALQLNQASPQRILKLGIERFGAQLGIAFSGAEDVVLLDMAQRLGLPFRVFCLDTGRLHPETYVFIEKVRQHYGLEVEMFSPNPERLEPFVREKGLFSFLQDGHQECCGIRKIEPLRRALRGLEAWVTGQRKDQSVTRVELAVIQADLAQGAGRPESQPLVKLNPLANWSSADVWKYIRANQLPHNPLHERGFISIGCEPCTRPTLPGEHERAGRWWWEEATQRECGVHVVSE
jgi:phosphoadenosine phosphosulfate reductase